MLAQSQGHCDLTFWWQEIEFKNGLWSASLLVWSRLVNVFLCFCFSLYSCFCVSDVKGARLSVRVHVKDRTAVLVEASCVVRSHVHKTQPGSAAASRQVAQPIQPVHRRHVRKSKCPWSNALLYIALLPATPVTCDKSQSGNIQQKIPGANKSSVLKLHTDQSSVIKSPPET